MPTRVTQGFQKQNENAVQLPEKKHGNVERRNHGTENQMQTTRRSSGILQKQHYEKRRRELGQL